MSWLKLADRLNAADRTKIRAIFAANSSVPVYVDDVEEASIHGEEGGWFTRGGTRIYFPSAYSKKGYSNMVYQCSTKYILVPKKKYKKIS